MLIPSPSRTRRSLLVCAALLVAAGSSFPASFVAAQQPGRGTPPREIRGTLKSVDAPTRAVTITTFGPDQTMAEKTFTLAKDAEIAVGDGTPRRNYLKAGKLADLAPGAALGLTLADDQKTVTSVLAQGPTVRAVIKSVDASQKTLVVTPFPTGRDSSTDDVTYRLAADAEIGLDDGRGHRFSIHEGRLQDLAPGATVTLQLSPDQKEAQSAVAEGPTLSGQVKSADAGGKKLEIVLVSGRGGEEPESRTLDVAADAAVLLDDGRGRRLSLTAGKLGDVPAGSIVRVRLSADQKQAVQITAEGPSQSGLVKSVDADKRTITIARFVGRGQEPEETTLPVSADARITVDNKLAGLADVKPADNGPLANLRLSLDQKTVQGISIINR